MRVISMMQAPPSLEVSHCELSRGGLRAYNSGSEDFLSNTYAPGYLQMWMTISKCTVALIRRFETHPSIYPQSPKKILVILDNKILSSRSTTKWHY